jgi:4,5-DOPA dioxygenase extradiol
MTEPMPALFVSHGSPMVLLDGSEASRFLTGLPAALARPRDILVVSAHWETAVPTVSEAAAPQTMHDFGGFPRALHEATYPAPGAPQLACRAADLLAEAGFDVERSPDRGLDHGAWIPLKLMYPDADVPVTQLSIQPHLGPQHHYRIGEALRPLRDDGTLVMGSGSVTHNLEAFFREGYGRDAAVPDWVAAFADWLAAALEEGRVGDLLAYRDLAPHAVRNHPSEDHLLPLFVACGAASELVRAQRLHASRAYGVLAMDAYALR